MTTNITIKKIDERVVDSLKQQAAASSMSLNEFVKQSLTRISGLNQTASVIYEDLNYLAGTWTEEDAEEFRLATKAFGEVDKELWK